MIDGYSTNGLIVMHLAWLGPVAIALYRTLRRPTNRRLQVWMTSRGLDPHGDERPIIERHLYRTRWYRSMGFMIGWSIPFVLQWVTRNADAPLSGWYLPLAIAGFGIGVVLGEVFAPPGPASVSAVEPRLLRQYIPLATPISPLVLSAVPAVMAIYAYSRPSADNHSLPYWLLGLAGPVAALALHLVTRFIVERPQRAASMAAIRADDALRAYAAQAVLGASYMAVGLLWLVTFDKFRSAEPPLVGQSLLSAMDFTAFIVGFMTMGIVGGFVSDRTKWVVPRARDRSMGPAA